jgi:alpha-ketoglutarate-dependent taurine dioxygenase
MKRPIHTALKIRGSESKTGSFGSTAMRPSVRSVSTIASHSNNNDRVPFGLGSEEMAKFYQAYGHFFRLANDPARQLYLKLAPGWVLVLDNWRVLHGRHRDASQRHFPPQSPAPA